MRKKAAPPKGYNSEIYKKPSLTCDICICTIIDNELKILLIKRRDDPFKDCWAIPGGFLDVDKDETLDSAAYRELKEETSVEGIYLEQLKTYGDQHRDPRLRVITVAYFALLPIDKIGNVQAGDDAKEAKWFSLSALPDLAFDHAIILTDLKNRLAGKISYTPIAFSLLPKYFTWNILQNVYEAVLGKKLLKANFRRKIKSQYLLAFIDKTIRIGKITGRPSMLIKYEGIKDNGY